jgi:hypothetical protein
LSPASSCAGRFEKVRLIIRPISGPMSFIAPFGSITAWASTCVFDGVCDE